MASITWIVLFLVFFIVFLFLYVVGVYNRLVHLKNRLQNSFAQIEVQLKRRHDLIPNLVEVAKGYMQHEKSTLEEVIQARNQAVTHLNAVGSNPVEGSALTALGKSENILTGALSRLFALVENYPDLKANASMMQLSEEIISTENKVAFARQNYNDVAMQMNSFKQSFPPCLIANSLGFSVDATLLQFESSEIEKAPQVKF